jgi:hypothetical protein
MGLAKIAKGISSAAVRFVIVGIVFPFLLEYFSPTLSSYVQLPPADQVWETFILFGALYGVTSFLQTAYSKGEYLWLLGKLGSGVVSILFFTYLFLLLPNTVGSAGIQSTGLLSLIYLAVGLSYAYLVLDFYDARRSRNAKPKEEPVIAAK